MSQLEFLEGILPEGTRYSLRLINKKTQAASNRFYSSVREMVDALERGFGDGIDVYYATAGFGVASAATTENAVAKRELYVDIDCGAGKPYPDKAAGITALREFCKTAHLPKPTLVDSGNGLHAHWIFTEALPIHKWSEAANALKSLCKTNNFFVDNACTADVVRVLRVPDTTNWKNQTPVVQLTKLVQYEPRALLSILTGLVKPDDDFFARAKALSKTAPSGMSGMSKTLATGDPNRINRFETIWLKSVKGEGCAQIENAITNSADLPEPLWRAVLSIAQYCEDRDWAIHEISKAHPGYDEEETERKAALTKGPYTCETFQGSDSAPLCAGCQHAGKITSPIQLGATISITKPEEKVAVAYHGRAFDIPTYPWPYVRGKNGGIYVRAKENKKGEETGDSEKEEFELVYPYDLYAYKRMRDSEMGDVVWMRLHLPVDGVREFMIMQREIAATDKLRDRLSEQGVTAFSPAQLNKLQNYIGRSIQVMQETARAETMHARFGWTQFGTFVVGNREYGRDGAIHAPVARGLNKYVSVLEPKGTLEGWKAVVDMYKTADFALHAFGVLCGFGSVLMHLSPENGGVVNYFSKKSGTGKTTILKVINSIWGDPKALMKDAQDTHLSKVHRMGVMNGLPVCFDEMTNTRPEEMSSMLYGSTQGRARDRMKAGENAERQNDMTWKLITIWSSNTSVEDRLGMIKFDPQGEMARVIDIHLRTPVPRDVLTSQKIFNKLNDNYGHAGNLFLSYLIPNIEEVKEIWNEMRDGIYRMREWTQTERYRLNIVICALTAGYITNKIGLTSFNLSRIGKSVVKYVAEAGEALRQQELSTCEMFAAFINRNINNMLSIDSKPRTNGLQNEPYVKPKGTLVIRYEPNTKVLYIVQKEFNRWCAENYINARELRSSFREETGRELEVVKKRMGAGWDTDFGSVSAYCIQNAHEVLGIEVKVDETAEQTT
jgi:hypothetical protein